MLFPPPRSKRRRSPRSRFPNPIRRSDPILPGCLPARKPMRRGLKCRKPRYRIPNRKLNPKPHLPPKHPNRPPNPVRSQNPNPLQRPNRLRSRSLHPNLPLWLNRPLRLNLLRRPSRRPLRRRNPSTLHPRCSGWRRRRSATATNSASSCRSTIRPRPPKSLQGPKRRKDRRSVPRP